jgi:hypothetical protein
MSLVEIFETLTAKTNHYPLQVTLGNASREIVSAHAAIHSLVIGNKCAEWNYQARTATQPLFLWWTMSQVRSLLPPCAG